MREQTLADQLTAVKALVDAAIAEAGGKIESGPDNPAILQRSSSVRAFTISSKEVLGGPWSAQYHDWLWQYRHVRELLENHRFSALQKLLDGKTVDSVLLAPEVIERVKGIVGDLATANAK